MLKTQCHCATQKILFKVMNRRGEDKSVTWKKFAEELEEWEKLKPKIIVSLNYQY